MARRCQRVEREASDSDLVEACRTGRQEAWDALVERYARLVQSVPLKLGLAPNEAEDVTQATFMALIHGMSSIQQPDRLSSWLVTVARRETFRVRHHPDRSCTHVEYDIAEPDTADDIAQAVWLHDTLTSLGEPCRGLLLQLFFDPTHRTYGEIAAEMGFATGSIGPLRSGCLRELRRRIERVEQRA